MPRKPYWLHETRDDHVWEFRGKSKPPHHVNRPKTPYTKPLLHKGRKHRV